MNEDTYNWLVGQIAQLPANYFGSLKLEFADGKLVRIVKEESLKPPVDKRGG